jgi:hypothetical protein
MTFLYECYAIAGHPKFLQFDFLQSVIMTIDTQTGKVGATLVPLLKYGNHIKII